MAAGTLPTVLRSIGVGFLLAFAVLGLAFLLGETFADPGDLSPWLVAALVLVPTLLLSGAVLWRLPWADSAVVVVSVAVALLVLVDGVFDLLPHDVGPVPAAAGLVVAAPLALLGWHDPRHAGELLVMVGLAPAVASIAFVTGEPGPGRGLGGSTGAVAVPLMVGGAVLLLSAWADRRTAARRPRTG